MIGTTSNTGEVTTENSSKYFRWHEALKSVNHPVFVVWGNEDAVAPVWAKIIANFHSSELRNNEYLQPYQAIIGESIAELTRGAILRSEENVGHFLMLENPKFWTDSMVEFLQKVIE